MNSTRMEFAGVEFVPALGGGAATLAVAGAGRYSLDAVIAARRPEHRSS